MFSKNMLNLSDALSLVKQCFMKLYFAALLLPLLVMTSMQTSGSPNTYTFIGNTVMQHANFIPSTGMNDNAPIQHYPGHDFNALYAHPNLDNSLLKAAGPFSYTLSQGTIVVRRSELGPLTGTVGNSLPIRGPGHDFGAIDGD